MDHIETFKSPDKRNNFIFQPENLIGCLTTTNQVQIETKIKIKGRSPEIRCFVGVQLVYQNPRFVYWIKHTQTIFENLLTLEFIGGPQ